MVFLDAILCFGLSITLKCFYYNFTLGDIYFIKLKFDYLRINEDIGKGWEKRSDKVNRLSSELVIIKNLTVKDWYLWVNKASLC